MCDYRNARERHHCGRARRQWDFAGGGGGAGIVKSKLQIVEIVRHGMMKKKLTTEQGSSLDHAQAGWENYARDRDLDAGRCWKRGSIVSG